MRGIFGNGNFAFFRFWGNFYIFITAAALPKAKNAEIGRICKYNLYASTEKPLYIVY